MAKAPAKPSAKSKAFPTLTLETVLIQQDGGPVCGVDEAGRGPWAGPVSAAAVILNPRDLPEGVDDSKALTALRREALEGEIKARALAWGVGFASVEEIAELNILQATGLAMCRAIEALAVQRGEVIVPNGAAAANALGLTTQVPVRSVYLTSGRSRTMTLGKQLVELRHAPRWQLALADRPAGQAVRALAWLGPEKAESALKALKRKLPPTAFGELVAAAPQFPTWLARCVGKAVHG